MTELDLKSFELIQELRRELKEQEKAFTNALEAQERSFTKRLAELCRIDEIEKQQEQEEDDSVTEQLKSLTEKLESLKQSFKDFETKYQKGLKILSENQATLHNQLKELLR